MSGYGSYVVWSAALAGTAVALWLVLVANSTKSTTTAGTAELASLGFGPTRVGVITALVTLTGALGVGFYAWQQLLDQPNSISTQSIAEAISAGLLVVLLVPTLLPRILRALGSQRYVRRRDAAALLWMRRIRLLVAGGRPTNSAVLDAAEYVTEPAFRPLAGAINLAISTGRDPLAAAANKMQGSDAAALLKTVNAAERSGAAATELIDKVLSGVVSSLDDQRRERIDRLGKTAAVTASLNAILFGAVVLLMVATTLPAF